MRLLRLDFGEGVGRSGWNLRHVTADVRGSIWVIHADGSGLREIHVQGLPCGGSQFDPNGFGCHGVHWSPDGGKIMASIFEDKVKFWNEPYNKQLLVARVRPEQLADFGAWRYWNGTRWVADVAQSAALTGRVSPELSVSPLADGRYLLVFELDTLSGDVAIRVGDSPMGPWGAAQMIWACPEEHQQPYAKGSGYAHHAPLSATKGRSSSRIGVPDGTRGMGRPDRSVN